jgi:putative ABC transport system permease protein
MTNDRGWPRLKRVFRLPFTRSRIDAALREEFRFHLQERLDQFVAAGMPRDLATEEVARRFGNYEAYRKLALRIDEETMRQKTLKDTLDSIRREVGLAARVLTRAPGFTFITIVTLALGIGAATSIFTLLDAVVLRPLPYPNADRLVRLSSPVPLMKGQTEWGLARHEMYYFVGKGHSLDAIGVYQVSDVTVLGSNGTQAERVRWARVSASLLNVLGFRPEKGRLITADDNHSQLPTIVLLAHSFWARRFGSDRRIIGKTINIEGFPMTVAGVLPVGADLPEVTVDVWAPAFVDSTTVYNNHTWSAIGRLRPGFTAAESQRELAPLTARLPEAFPNVYNPRFIKNTGFTTKVVSLRDSVVGTLLTRALWTLFAAVALVLLIATANVANLFLVRLDARSREVAMRTALGAERSHLAWHYLAESFLLAGVAGLAAIAIAETMLKVLLAVAPSQLPRLSEVRLSGASIAFALGGALVAGVIFGVMPLLGRPLDVAALREGGRGLLSSRRRMNARRILVATQMALAVVLLAAAMLMVRTFRNLRDVKSGFDPAGVATMQIALPESRYGGRGKNYFEAAARSSSFFEQLVTRVSQLPGVTRVGLTERMPLIDGDWCTGITLEGPTPDAARGVCPADASVSPGYFEAMGIRLTGQTMTWGGMNAHDGSVIVSKAFADHYWPNETPIGKGLKFNGTKPPFYHVTAVAEDIRANGVDAPPVEMVYFPMLPIPDAALWGTPTNMHLVIKGSKTDATELGRIVARLAAELEPQAAISNPQTLSGILAASMAKQSFTMALLVIAAGIAMLLAAVGIYGVISYIVAQRRGEIGVRMALGAEVRSVTLLVLRQSLSMAVIGIVLGVVGALATTRFLRALLFGVEPNDMLTLTVVPLALIGIVIVASYAPARQAAKIDPVEALRGD